MENENITYIWQQPDWPHWHFDMRALTDSLSDLHRAQNRLFDLMETFDSAQRKQLTLQILTDDVLKTCEIEGEQLDFEAVRSSVARHLSMDIGQPIPADRQIDGIVSLVISATKEYARPLTQERLFSWHDELFPTSYSIISTINTESWRNDANGPMQVVSGSTGQQKIHYEAPPAQRLNAEMANFLRWFNVPATTDPLIKAGLAHLWFLTVHPFGDGNGRIARAISDMALARAIGTSQRFYSYATQIQRERNNYYGILEATQKSGMDVTAWLSWFLACLKKSIGTAEVSL